MVEKSQTPVVSQPLVELGPGLDKDEIARRFRASGADAPLPRE
jgi:hypothetical protein